MANLNIVTLLGRLAKDPELRRTQNDIPVTTFSVAVNRRGKDQGVDFIDVVCWRNQAEFVCRYFSKGMAIFVEGSIQTRTWKDKNGNNRKAVEVVAYNVQFAEPKRDNSPAASPDYEEIADANDDLPF